MHILRLTRTDLFFPVDMSLVNIQGVDFNLYKQCPVNLLDPSFRKYRRLQPLIPHNKLDSANSTNTLLIQSHHYSYRDILFGAMIFTTAIALLASQASASITVPLSLASSVSSLINATGLAANSSSSTPTDTPHGPYTFTNETGALANTTFATPTAGIFYPANATGHGSPTGLSFPTSGFHAFSNGTGHASPMPAITDTAASPPTTNTTLTYLLRGRPKTIVIQQTAQSEHTTAAAAATASVHKTQPSMPNNDSDILTRGVVSPAASLTPGQLYIDPADPRHLQCDGPQCPPMIYHDGVYRMYTNNPEQHHIYSVVLEHAPATTGMSAPSVMILSRSVADASVLPVPVVTEPSSIAAPTNVRKVIVRDLAGSSATPTPPPAPAHLDPMAS